jgi:hypothetical protein
MSIALLVERLAVFGIALTFASALFDAWRHDLPGIIYSLVLCLVCVLGRLVAREMGRWEV